MVARARAEAVARAARRMVARSVARSVAGVVAQEEVVGEREVVTAWVPRATVGGGE